MKRHKPIDRMSRRRDRVAAERATNRRLDDLSVAGIVVLVAVIPVILGIGLSSALAYYGDCFDPSCERPQAFYGIAFWVSLPLPIVGAIALFRDSVVPRIVLTAGGVVVIASSTTLIWIGPGVAMFGALPGIAILLIAALAWRKRPWLSRSRPLGMS